LKALDADATPDWGTCPSNPPPSNEKFCGANSAAFATAAYNGSSYTPISADQTVYARCWTTGGNIPNDYSAASPGSAITEQSTAWVLVYSAPSGGSQLGYMSTTYFNPPGNNNSGSPVTNGLPGC
jgi:hypothetical protein